MTLKTPAFSHVGQKRSVDGLPVSDSAASLHAEHKRLGDGLLVSDSAASSSEKRPVDGLRPGEVQTYAAHCIICGPQKRAQNTDPVSKHRFCRICFVDVRPNLACKESSEDVSLATARCFACFHVGEDVSEVECEGRHMDRFEFQREKNT